MEFKYKAFISYRHVRRDSRAAKVLHNLIETYRIPDRLRKHGQKHLGKVFRDEEELGASSDLAQHIRNALDMSEFLIVICSPEAVKSRWVSAEIRYFLEHHPKERLLTVLTGGRAEEIFGQLLPGLPEPKSLDLTGSSNADLTRDLRERFLELCAPMLGCEYDELVRREVKRRQRKSLTVLGIVLFIASVIIGILLWSNHQIEEKNAVLDRQNQELLLRESEILTREAQEALAAGDRVTAIEKSVAALPSQEQERRLYAPAEQVLFSAIDPFRETRYNYVFLDTVLKQNTSVQDFCINTDGTLLTTADCFNTLTCFDTATGEVQWRIQLADYYIYKDSRVVYCALYDLILCYNRGSIAGVSQKTGELLWQMDPDNAETDWFILREEDGIFAFIKQELDDSRKNNAYSLLLCSAKDGAVISQIAMIPDKDFSIEDAGAGKYTFFDADQRKHPPGCFTSDGRYFVCACYDRNGDIIYFLADTRAQSCSVLRIEDDEVYRRDSMYYLSAVDGDEFLLSIRKLPDKINVCLVERIRIPDGTVLWKQEIAADGNGCVVCGTQRNLLIGAGRELYEMGWSDGEIICTGTMDDDILDLCTLENGEFAYLLKNGVSSAGWSNDLGFHDTQVFNDGPFDLGGGSIGQLWNGGSIRLEIADSRVNGFTMSDERSGGGYAVMIPQENDHCVVISRPYQIPVIVEREYSAEIPNGYWINSQNIGEEALVLFNSLTNEDMKDNRIVILDPMTMEKKAEYTTKEYLIESQVLFLKDGSGYLYDSLDSVFLVDLKTGSSEEICRRFSDLFSRGDILSERDRIFGVSNGRLSESGDVLTVEARKNGIQLWRNGEFWKKVTYPKKLKRIDDPWHNLTLTVGANGMVLLSLADETENRLFFAYDVFRDAWHRIETDIPGESSIEILTGQKEPLFMVLDSEGMVQVYDIQAQALQIRFPSQVPLNFMKDMQFCVKDTCVLFLSKDYDLTIYDAAMGELVYEQKIPWAVANSIVCFEDQSRGCLFLCSGSLGDDAYCLSTDNWTVLTEIPGMMLYNEHTGRLVQTATNYTDQFLEIWVCPMLSTEELTAAGRDILKH